MTENTFRSDLISLLEDLQSALSSADMWSEVPPSTEALSSTAPFCIDTLLFEEWCQWVFIPQLQHLIEKPDFSGLVASSSTHEMAVFSFSQRSLNDDNIEDILFILQRVDACLNAQLPTKH